MNDQVTISQESLSEETRGGLALRVVLGCILADRLLAVEAQLGVFP